MVGVPHVGEHGAKETKGTLRGNGRIRNRKDESSGIARIKTWILTEPSAIAAAASPIRPPFRA